MTRCLVPILGTLLLLAVTACGSQSKGPSEEVHPAPPSSLTATTDRSEGVVLEWSAPSGAEALVVERDGVEIARLDPHAERFEDREAAPGSVMAAELAPADSDIDSISLSWTGPRVVDGADHEYVVVALFARGTRVPSAPVTGRRATPEVVELALERDGSDLAKLAIDADSFVDEGAGPWSLDRQEVFAEGDPDGVFLEWAAPEVVPGPLHRYAIVATLADGSRVPSDPVEARRRTPKLTGFDLLRDGARIASPESDFYDVEADPFVIGDVVLVAGDAERADAVELAWNLPEPTDGAEHEYVVVAHFDGAPDLESEPVVARRPAPRVLSIELSRDGIPFATLDSSATSYEDWGATPATLSEPNFHASKGDRAEGVELRWDVPNPTIHPHVYGWVATLDKGIIHEANWAMGSRAPPSLLGYTLATVGGTTEIPASSTYHLDRYAPAGSLRMGPVTATVDRHDAVRVAWEEPSTLPGHPVTYSLEQHYEGTSGRSFFASGFRGEPAVGGFVVYRDGAPIAPNVSRHDRQFDDRDADPPPPLGFSNVEAVGWPLEVSLSWLADSSTRGTLHTYEVSAVSEFGDESARQWAQGGRLLRQTGLVLERDGIVIAADPMGRFTDEDVEPASTEPPSLSATEDREGEVLLTWTDPPVRAGRTYRYQLVATASDGTTSRSPELEAGTTAPQLLSFVLYRDGGQYRSVADPQARSQIVDAARGTISVELTATDGTVDEGVDLGWTVASAPGPRHAFSIKARYSPYELDTELSPVAWGRSAAPSPTGFEVYRMGDSIAALPGDARTFADRGVPRAPTAPSQVFASMDRPDAVAVTWTEPWPTSPDLLYSVEMSHAEGSMRVHDLGHRMGLTIDRHVVLRDGVEAGSVPADTLRFDDAGATWQNGLVHSVRASDGTRADGVELSWSSFAPLGRVHTYSIETVYTNGERASTERGAIGSLSAPTLVGYELERDGGEWQPVGMQQTYLDTAAPLGDTTPIEPTLEIDPVLSIVTLHHGGASWIPAGPSTYRIRALYDHGPPVVSGEVSGKRQPVARPITLRWQRSIADADAGFADLPDATLPDLHVVDSPVDEGRYYRLQTLVDGSPFAATPATRVVLPGFRRVATDHYTTCAIQTDGTLRCFGHEVPGLMTPPPGQFRELSLGSFHACALRDDDRIVCWGDNPIGNAPAEPVPGPFVSVAAGHYVSCGTLASDGSLSCWGETWEVGPPEGALSQISFGWRRFCALEPAGTANCWGLDPWVFPGAYQQIQLGEQFACALDVDGTPTCQGIPAGIEDVPSGRFISVSAGTTHACAIRDDGEVRCWGNVPTSNDPALGMHFSDLSAGLHHACGVRDDLKLECWGVNSGGQAPRRP